MDPKPKTTPKDFFLWAGAMVSFYWSVLAYVWLVFDYINYLLPDPLRYYPANPYQSGISYEMASLIVLLPVFLILMKLIRDDIARDPSRSEIWVRRWALILTLFVAGTTIVVDVIMLLTKFLNGEELTTAFLLKSLVVLLVAAAVFAHFISDIRGYWTLHPKRKQLVVIAVSVLAIATIIAGFFIVGTPRDARLTRYDEQKVSDLQSLYAQITYYWQAKRTLPASLDDLNDSLSYGPVPATDPQTGEPYKYKATGPLSFELCATFNRKSGTNPSISSPEYYGPKDRTVNWQHGTGEVCFERTIDPAFYPPLR